MARTEVTFEELVEYIRAGIGPKINEVTDPELKELLQAAQAAASLRGPIQAKSPEQEHEEMTGLYNPWA